MIKNQANIYQFVLRDMIGQGMTGLSPTVRIRKDTGSFAATTNTPTEVGNGLYEVALTATECNCDIMAIEVSLPDGQFPAILTNEYLTTTGGATPAEIWQYSGGRTVTNTIPTAADNATAVWGAQTKEVTIATAQADTFATASSVANIATVANTIKSKTDNLPANPAAVTDVTTAQAAIISAMPDISNLATSANVTTAQNSIIAAMPDISGLSTFDAATDTVTIDATQAAGMQTATGFATPANITDAVTALETYGDGKWLTADVSSLATSAELATSEGNIISAMPVGFATPSDIPTEDITAIKAGLYNWELVRDGSTESITAKSGSSTVAQSTITRNSAGEIVKMEETE